MTLILIHVDKRVRGAGCPFIFAKKESELKTAILIHFLLDYYLIGELD